MRDAWCGRWDCGGEDRAWCPCASGSRLGVRLVWFPPEVIVLAVRW